MSARKRLVIIGAAGQARDAAFLAREIGGFELVGFVVSDTSKLTDRDTRDLVRGDFDWLDAHRRDVDAVAIGVGTPSARLRIAATLRERFPELDAPALVHPGALFDRASAELGAGSMIACGVAGTVNVVLEPFALVNVAVTLGHEARFGEGCVVNHGASISGGVVLERGALVGTGARVLQYLRVGAGATVGAGAVVTKDVPPGETWVGVPARRR